MEGTVWGVLLSGSSQGSGIDCNLLVQFKRGVYGLGLGLKGLGFRALWLGVGNQGMRPFLTI